MPWNAGSTFFIETAMAAHPSNLNLALFHRQDRKGNTLLFWFLASTTQVKIALVIFYQVEQVNACFHKPEDSLENVFKDQV